jgi:hypothetical protein
MLLMAVFWVAAPCSLVEVSRYFRVACYLTALLMEANVIEKDFSDVYLFATKSKLSLHLITPKIFWEHNVQLENHSSPPASAEVKNAWSISISLHSVGLQQMGGVFDNCFLFLLVITTQETLLMS